MRYEQAEKHLVWSGTEWTGRSHVTLDAAIRDATPLKQGEVVDNETGEVLFEAEPYGTDTAERLHEAKERLARLEWARDRHTVPEDSTISWRHWHHVKATRESVQIDHRITETVEDILDLQALVAEEREHV